MAHAWHLEGGRFVLRGRGALSEKDFAVLWLDLQRRKVAHGRGLRSTTGLAETVARRDRRVVEKLAAKIEAQGAEGADLMRQVLKVLRLGRLAQSVEAKAFPKERT